MEFQAATATHQTFEIGLWCLAPHDVPTCAKALARFGQNNVIDNAWRSVAVVYGDGLEKHYVWFIVTSGKSQRPDNALRMWKAQLQKVVCEDGRKLPDVATVEKVRLFTRFSQRRFDWGDLEATREEVVRASQSGDTWALLKIMPKARVLLEQGEETLAHMPTLFDAERTGRLAIADSAPEDDEQQKALQAYHDMTGGHTWEASSKHCDACGCGCGSKYCDKCQNRPPTQQCSCGATRCNLHLDPDAPSRELKVFTYGMPGSPCLFLVSPARAMDTATQLEWLLFELGPDAPLDEFAKKFVELFSERVGKASQKDTCLRLYRQYAGIETRTDLQQGPYDRDAEVSLKMAQKKVYSMTCQVPPEEYEAFAKVFDDTVERRCHEYGCKLPADTPAGQNYCAAHANAGRKLFCGGCGGEGKELLGIRTCTGCGKGADVAKWAVSHQGRLTNPDSRALDRSLKRNCDELAVANNVWGFGTVRDEAHVPAWTKRRRLQ